MPLHQQTQPPLQCYRQKSPASVSRDIVRHDMWRNKTGLADSTKEVNGVDILESTALHQTSDTEMQVHTIVSDNDSPLLIDSGVFSILSKNDCVTNTMDIIKQSLCTQTDVCKMDTMSTSNQTDQIRVNTDHVQTDAILVRERYSQVKTRKHKRNQTEFPKSLVDKCYQTIPISVDNTAQTCRIRPKVHTTSTLTDESIKKCAMVETDRPPSKHAQTLVFPASAVGTQATSSRNTASQTLTKKQLKKELEPTTPIEQPKVDVHTDDEHQDSGTFREIRRLLNNVNKDTTHTSVDNT